MGTRDHLWPYFACTTCEPVLYLAHICCDWKLHTVIRNLQWFCKSSKVIFTSTIAQCTHCRLTHVILLTCKIRENLSTTKTSMYTVLRRWLLVDSQVYAYTYLNSDNICHVFKGMCFTIKSVSVSTRCVARHNVYAQKQWSLDSINTCVELSTRVLNCT